MLLGFIELLVLRSMPMRRRIRSPCHRISASLVYWVTWVCWVSLVYLVYLVCLVVLNLNLNLYLVCLVSLVSLVCLARLGSKVYDRGYLRNKGEELIFQIIFFFQVSFDFKK